LPTVPVNLYVARILELDVPNTYDNDMWIANCEDVAEFLPWGAPLRVDITPQRKEGLLADLVDKLL
jgi:hypothetical protein